MRRALILLGVAALTWLEFKIFPGHTYLQGDSQVYVPVIERLDAPGFLSRDLLAVHSHVTYTVYDEVTLSLHEAGRLSIHDALTWQQVLFRAAGIWGVFLIVGSTGLGDVAALLLAALLNFGAILMGPGVALIDRDPTPFGFASGLLLLAAGLIARGTPLLAGAAAGLALAYDPAIAAPFWIVLLLATLCDKTLRKLLKPSLTIFAVFVLLLANLAQLQPGISEASSLFGRISAQLAAIQKFRAPFLWVSLWAKGDVWQFLGIYVCGLWATVRIWKMLNRQLRWLALALPLAGILSLPLSAVLLEGLGWAGAAELKPAQTLIFTVAFAGIACGIAGVRSALEHKTIESWLWLIIVFAIPINTRIFELLAVTSRARFIQLITCLLSAGAASLMLQRRTIDLVAQNGPGVRRARLSALFWQCAILGLPIVAAFVLRSAVSIPAVSPRDCAAIVEVARWAEQNTWGSSMFLFPDAGHSLYPGIFRAESRRAVWVDWSSGDEVRYADPVAFEWWERWQKTMASEFSPPPMASLLTLPVDYYALQRSHELSGARPVFENSAFVVYDARDLDTAHVESFALKP